MYDSIKLIVFGKMTQRIEIFEIKKDSDNWTFFNMTQGLNLFFSLRLVNITRRIEPSFWICLNE